MTHVDLPKQNNACVLVLHSQSNDFTEEEINNSVRYLKDRMHAMKDDMQPFFLTQYSNPTL